MLSIEVLRMIWWLLLGVLISGFAVTDGFDFGAAFLMPFIAKKEIEKQVVLNTIRPFWEGNQVWIILGAGAVFAAWPYVYAVAFSGAYFVMLLLLLTMGISRPVSFKYREKMQNKTWRRAWDISVFIGGVVPPLIFGAVMGNLLLGLPFYFDNELRIFYTGTLIDLFSPFALLCAITSLAMLVMHGGFYVAMKTEQPIRARAMNWARGAALLLVLCFAAGGLWITQLSGFQVLGAIDHQGYSNPLGKQVIQATGAWLDNYRDYPYTMLAPLLGFVGALAAIVVANWWHGRLALFFSSIAIIGVISTVGVSMFPFILPSSINPTSSLLVWDASSSQLTLMLMLGAVLFFMPIILIYTSWVYTVLRGKVVPESIKEEVHYPPQTNGER